MEDIELDLCRSRGLLLYWWNFLFNYDFIPFKSYFLSILNRKLDWKNTMIYMISRIVDSSTCLVWYIITSHTRQGKVDTGWCCHLWDTMWNCSFEHLGAIVWLTFFMFHLIVTLFGMTPISFCIISIVYSICIDSL